MTRLALSLFPWIAHPVNRKNPPNVQAGRDEPLPSVSDKEFGPSTLPLLEIRMGFADQPLEHFALPACSDLSKPTPGGEKGEQVQIP